MSRLRQILSKKDVLLAYLAQGLNVASGLIVLPIALHHLNTSEMGLWIIFITLAGLFQLLELGLQPTISRYVSYAYAGAKNISTHGFDDLTYGEGVNQNLLNNVYASARSVYFKLSLVGVFLVVTVGPLYLWSVAGKSLALQAIVSWGFFGLGFLIQFYFSFLAAFIQGRGDINDFNKSLIVSKVAFVALSAGFLAAGFGLSGLALSSLISAIIGRIYVFAAFRRDPYSAQCPNAVIDGDGTHFAKMVGRNSFKLGLVNIGAFMITRGNILIASSYLGLAAAGSYGLTYQVLSTLSSLAATLYTLKYPKINVLQASGKAEEALQVYGAVVVRCILLLLVMTTGLLIFGNPLLTVLRSQTSLVAAPLLVLLSLVFLLELNGSLSASFLTTQNTIPFVPAALISGLAVLVCSLLFSVYLGLGLLGLILSQGLVQAAYNNWKWPMEVGRRSKVPYRQILMAGMRSLSPTKNAG